jgi:lipopolysaccharide transport system permease protein
MTVATDTHAAPLPRILLRPQRGWQPIHFRELWHYRELLWILALRDVKIRYKQTLLGVAWAVIQPLLSMVVFTVLFAGVGKIPTDGVVAPVFYFCGLLPWQLFTNSLTQAGNSLVGNQHLITKVYFPRLVIPIAAVITGLIDFAISFVVLIILMLIYQVQPGLQILALPLFVVMALAASLAVGFWLSALNVEYRDVRYVIPFLTQFWFFITPIIIPTDSLNRHHFLRALFAINPMSSVVEGFRWCMLGKPAPGQMLAVSALTIVVLLTGGLFYFRRMEKTFADLV